MKLAVPDMISNSYFPAIAAIELGFFKEEGLDVELELIFPVDKAYAALRDGVVDFVGGSAHSALAAFPEWQGVKLLCAQAQGMYWFLVMRSDLGARRGDLAVVKDRRIGAAPWVEMGLRRLLMEAGIDLERDGVQIAPVPGATGAGINFGVTAAQALADGKIDGFWANGMGAEVAVRGSALSYSTFAAAMGQSRASTTPWRRLRPPTGCCSARPRQRQPPFARSKTRTPP
jgi:NitT/TauT family transport system substrate-binding protein